MNEITNLAAVVTLIAALMAAAVRVQAERERRYPSETNGPDALYVTSGAAVRRMSLAYTPLAADVYWIRALQYYGGTKRQLASEPPSLIPPPALAADPSGQYPLLYPLLDLTTTLDPGSTWRIDSARSFWPSRFPMVPAVRIWR